MVRRAASRRPGAQSRGHPRSSVRRDRLSVLRIPGAAAERHLPLGPDPGVGRARRSRQGLSCGRLARRHHGPQAGRARAARRDAAGRGGDPRQEPVPRQHEPRAAHPPERRDRHHGDAGGGCRGSRPGRFRRAAAPDPRRRQPSSASDQRDPGPVQDRGRPARAALRGHRRQAADRRDRDDRSAARRQERQPARDPLPGRHRHACART